MKIGEMQQLTIVRKTDFGLYLAESSDSEEQVLLPGNQIPEGASIGDELTVFIYRDSKDRPIATLKTPRMTLGKIGRCRVAEVGRIGAFLEWGLEKDLLLPFREMTGEIKAGMEIPVALYLDKSERLCATMKIYKHLSVASGLKKGDTVSGTVYEISDNFGAFTAIDDKYQGLIPKREMVGSIRVGDVISARVVAIKDDGKVDLSVREPGYIQMDIDADRLIKLMNNTGRALDFTDKASPDVIRNATGMSKNEFKRAIGRLLKLGLVEIKNDSIVLTKKAQ